MPQKLQITKFASEFEFAASNSQEKLDIHGDKDNPGRAGGAGAVRERTRRRRKLSTATALSRGRTRRHTCRTILFVGVLFFAERLVYSGVDKLVVAIVLLFLLTLAVYRQTYAS